MRTGRFDVACAELAESYRIDPMAGALFTLAECEAAWGKSATAMSHYAAFVSSLASMDPERRDRFAERRHLAIERITALSALAPELTIVVSSAAPANLRIKRDGSLVPPSSYGVNKTVDPGEYLLTAEIGEKPLWKRQVTLAERDRARIEVPWPLHQPSAKLVAASATGTASVAASYAHTAPTMPSPMPTTASDTWMYLAGGIAIAGLGTGAISGIVALSQKSTIEANCPDHVCNPAGYQAVNAGKRAALVSNVGFSVGAVGGITALAYWLISRPSANQHPVGMQRWQLAAIAASDGGGLLAEGGF